MSKNQELQEKINTLKEILTKEKEDLELWNKRAKEQELKIEAIENSISELETNLEAENLGE